MARAITRHSVSSNTRYNVHQNQISRAIDSLMVEDWYSRFVAAIKADGRDMKTLSLAAHCGPNYIQQMIKDGKRPTVDKLIQILEVLGETKTFEILTGTKLTKEDMEFVRLTSKLDTEAKQAALTFFQLLREKQDNQERGDGSQD